VIRSAVRGVVWGIGKDESTSQAHETYAGEVESRELNDVDLRVAVWRISPAVNDVVGEVFGFNGILDIAVFLRVEHQRNCSFIFHKKRGRQWPYGLPA